jgi:hypothetical protein
LAKVINPKRALQQMKKTDILQCIIAQLQYCGVVQVFMRFFSGSNRNDGNFAFLQHAKMFQGFVITLPYCFLNTEVRGILRQHFERWKATR